MYTISQRQTWYTTQQMEQKVLSHYNLYSQTFHKKEAPEEIDRVLLFLCALAVRVIRFLLLLRCMPSWHP